MIPKATAAPPTAPAVMPATWPFVRAVPTEGISVADGVVMDVCAEELVSTVEAGVVTELKVGIVLVLPNDI